MLSMDERRRLEQLEQHLRSEDPRFAARMAGRRTFKLPKIVFVLGALVWAAIVVAAAAGRWFTAGVIVLTAAFSIAVVVRIARSRC